MKSVSILLMLSGSALSGQSVAEQVWVGFEGSHNGFLIDLDTGATTMTGTCLRQIQPVRTVNGQLVSENSTLEDLGRVQVRLDQTFVFELRDDRNAVVTVQNQDRGGAQTFSALQLHCAADPFCKQVMDAPRC